MVVPCARVLVPSYTGLGTASSPEFHSSMYLVLGAEPLEPNTS